MENNWIIDFQKADIHLGGKVILRNVNFQLKQGEFVYVIGKIGSGKTSLIKTINAEIPLMKGKGKVAGYHLSVIRRRQIPFLRRKLGIVFQDYQLLIDRTVYKNMYFILKATGWTDKKAMKKRISEVLLLTNMEGSELKMPHELSGGEQQRIVIARALLNSPEIILADEPTGNLDPETSYALVQLLMDISKSGTSTIMATHQYDLLEKFPSRTLQCEDGKLIEITV